jgi:hypothetical protein
MIDYRHGANRAPDLKVELTEREVSLLLFIIQDYWSLDKTNVETRDSILKKLR